MLKLVEHFIRDKRNLLALMLCTVIAGGCANMTYYDYPPDIPIPLQPALSSVIANQTEVRFSWRTSENAEHYDFHVFNRANSDIDTYYMDEIDPETICFGGLCEISLTLELPVMKGHAWRVRAGNFAGKSAWTRTMFESTN